jgi:flagellar protein FlaJ
MIRFIDRGHPVNAYLHFVLLTWIGMTVAHLTQYLAGGLINV